MKDKGVRNLTREGITIVDYKKLLMQESASRSFSSVFLVTHYDSLFLCSYRSRLDREGEAVQQGIHEPDGHLIHEWIACM